MHLLWMASQHHLRKLQIVVSDPLMPINLVIGINHSYQKREVKHG